MSGLENLAQLMFELSRTIASPRVHGRYNETRVTVRTAWNKTRPIKLIGVDGEGTVVIVLEDEEVCDADRSN